MSIQLNQTQLSNLISKARQNTTTSIEELMSTLSISSKNMRVMKCSHCNSTSHTKPRCPDLVHLTTCKRCGLSEDHYTANCPKNRQRVRKCSNCKEQGHFIYNCPKPVVEKTKKVYHCKLCGSPEHNSKTCPDSDSDRRNTCGICFEKGHNRTTCKKQCDHCGLTGHSVTDCPNWTENNDQDQDIPYFEDSDELQEVLDSDSESDSDKDTDTE